MPCGQHIVKPAYSCLTFKNQNRYRLASLRFQLAAARFLRKSDAANNRIWLPINLKVSSFRGRDDLSSKDGLFYALTGKDPEHCDWDRYCQELAAHLKRDNCCADYYYIVVQKSRPGTPRGNVFWTSLLALRCVHPNGNRPPFQCHWAENTERLSWPRKEAVAYLLGVLEETLTLRANASASFKKHLTPMLRGWGPKPV